jgi:hypothetical protein
MNHCDEFNDVIPNLDPCIFGNGCFYAPVVMGPSAQKLSFMSTHEIDES